MRWMRLLGALASLLAVTTGAGAQTDPYALRAGAWDKSVQLERSGDFRGARDLLMQAWGTQSDSYEVTMRLAYLESRLGRIEEAIALYRRARAMPPAGADAADGLALALTAQAYSRMEEGDREGARERLEEAVAASPDAEAPRRGLALLGPASRVDPEVWAAFLQQSVEPDKFQGWAVFAHVPWWVNDRFRLRLAARYLQTQGDVVTAPPDSPSPGNGPGRRKASSSRTTDRQGELYAAIGWSGRYVAVQGMGLAVVRKGEGLIPGGATSLKIGATAGLHVEQAILSRDAGIGWQTLPRLYWWPSHTVGLAAGARYTHDPRGGALSGVAGLSVVGRAAALHAQAHLGTERWPVTMDTPAVLALDSDLAAGAVVTSTFRLGDAWQMGVQGQWEKVEVPAFQGSYVSLATGLIWSP